MRRVFAALRWLLFLLLLMIFGLMAPVAYVELACRPSETPKDYNAVLPEDYHRPEARTLLTYPEWHIVHAYDDYAKVIKTDDPHHYAYVRSIRQFWSSLCALSAKSGDHGGFPWETKQMVYTIGVSFTAELLAKAAYEETLGRIATWIRGETYSALDDLSAEQAAEYAAFLQQVPWYKWDFEGDAAALSDRANQEFRDRERAFALGLEYGAKAAYAGVIEQAVAHVGADELTLRMIVSGLGPNELNAFEDVTIIAERNEGVEIETPRYRQLTALIAEMAGRGAEFVEIAGNDDILLTVTSDAPDAGDAMFSFARQGYGDWRHLIVVKVDDLADTLRDLPERAMTLEHIHDY